jgi:S1-C subfamily serine protease
MRNLVVLVLVVLLGGCQTNPPNKEEIMVNMMLRPSVGITVGKDGFGSGTVFKVTREGAYILTNHHVVSGSTDLVVHFYNMRGQEYAAELYSFDEEKDVAVIFAPHLCMSAAKLGRPGDVRLFKESVCVGTSSSYPIAPSRGIITQMDFERGERLLYRSDCNITFGNSGGGMYVEVDGSWVLVGIPTAVHAHNFFGNRAPVPFLGFMVRIEDILAHLEEHSLLP